MGRFLSVSPRNNERSGRRYAALPSSNSAELNDAHVVDTELPISTTSAAGNDVAAIDQQQLMTATERSDAVQQETDDEEEEGQFQNTRSTTQSMATETTERIASNQADAITTEDEKKRDAEPQLLDNDKKQDENNHQDHGNHDEEQETLEPGCIRIRILDLNGKFFNIVCQLDWTVARMKQEVMEMTDVAVTSQRLIYRGRVLEDEQCLEFYKVEDGHTIHLFVRATPTPDPEILATESNANGSTNNPNHRSFEDMHGATIIHISSDTITSAVYPVDSARRVDPLMLDCPLGNAARRVKLWSSFLLIIYTMKVMGQFALLANDQQLRQQREQAREHPNDLYHHPSDNRYDRLDYPPYSNQDPIVSVLMLLIHAFGVYVGCVGFKAAHDTDIRPIRFYCRGVVWLAVLTIAEQIFVTIQIAQSDYPQERIQYGYGGQMPSKDDIVSANIFQTVMLGVMWIVAVHHAYVHQKEVRAYNQSFAQAAMNAMPPVAIADTAV